jgi:hypothetical protein
VGERPAFNLVGRQEEAAIGGGACDLELSVSGFLG